MTVYNITSVLDNITIDRGDDVQSNDNNVTDDEVLEQIKQFIQPKIYHWIFLVLFFVAFVVGTSGNFLVCYSVWQSRSLKTVTNYFLVNLAVADFFVILVCLPASVSSDILSSWFLGLIMCKLSVYLQRVSVFVSVLTLTSISVERYMAICHPLRHHGTYMKTRLIIAIIWIVSLIIPSVDFYNMILVHHSQVPESLRPWMTTCTPYDEKMEREFNLFLIVAFYFIPLVVMSYTYVKIAICLWSSTSTRNAVSENLQYESAIEQLQVRRRTAKMLIVVVITFGICYLPIYVLNIARYTNILKPIEGNRAAMVCIYWTSRFLNYFNSAINPVIYNFMSVKFRKQFKTACFGCYVYLRYCCCCFKKSKGLHRRSSPVPTMKSMYPSTTRTNNFRLTYINDSRTSVQKISY